VITFPALRKPVMAERTECSCQFVIFARSATDEPDFVLSFRRIWSFLVGLVLDMVNLLVGVSELNASPLPEKARKRA
jgi:hypothetical protein